MDRRFEGIAGMQCNGGACNKTEGYVCMRGGRLLRLNETLNSSEKTVDVVESYLFGRVTELKRRRIGDGQREASVSLVWPFL